MILTAENSVKVCCCRVRKRKVDFFGSLAWLLSAINIGLLVVVILVPMWTIAEAQIAGVSYKWETGVFYHCTQIKGTNLQYPLAYDWTRCEASELIVVARKVSRLRAACYSAPGAPGAPPALSFSFSFSLSVAYTAPLSLSLSLSLPFSLSLSLSPFLSQTTGRGTLTGRR